MFNTIEEGIEVYKNKLKRFDMLVRLNKFKISWPDADIVKISTELNAIKEALGLTNDEAKEIAKETIEETMASRLSDWLEQTKD